MKDLNLSAAAKPRWPFYLLLAMILATLFWKSFLPDYVHFSNDGPLGQQNAAWSRLPDGFTGSWGDINIIGSNGGVWPFGLSALIRWVAGPVGFAKFYAPIALFVLGLGAWTFFRRLGLSPLAAVLGGLAATLNCSFFSRACWGIAQHPIAIGMDFFALSLIVSNTPQTPALTRWVRLALAGLAIGVGVMEGADVGAILSLFVAAFVFYRALNEEDVPLFKKVGGGIMRVAVVAVFAGFIALQTIVSLVGSQITGIVGTGQDKETKAANWDKATQWSLPKKETLGFFVPGIFGYRMDTPKDMTPSLRDTYQGGAYWGGAGRDPVIDRYFDKVFQPGDVVKINFPDDPGQNVASTIGQDGNVNLPLLGQTKLAGTSGSKLLRTINPAYSSRGIKAYVESPGGLMRFNGDGNYLGILVALLAAFAIAQSLRRENPPFTLMQKKFVWFWAVVMAVSLLLAWGRFAMFYQFFYALPYVSTIRNPVKFIFPFSWAMVILSAYGVHVLSRRYLEVPAGKTNSFSTQLINWWSKVRGFDRRWTVACAIAVAVSLLAWLMYDQEKTGLIRYLQTVGFPDEDGMQGVAKQIAAFSISQAGWFVLILALTAGLFTLILAGVFSGRRAKLGGILLGALLVVDLGRTDLPFIIHQDYREKYASNPIIDLLKDKPYEHRVAYGLPRPLETPGQFQLFSELYRIEWMQHHFPYYNIQSLDIVQMARGAADWAAFDDTFQIGIKQASSGRFEVVPETFPRVTRLWELTNTRYLLGPASLLDLLNQQFDPGQNRFRIAKRFSVSLKPDVGEFHQRLEELTAIPGAIGDYALFEFTGALPRAKLYSNWQVNTNDEAVLKTLVDKNFDPLQTVLVSAALTATPSTNGNSGTVEFKSYSPKDIVFDTKSGTASVLLLNDKFDQNWRVTVDGKPAELLRCNFIMRGVFLPPGAHTVEFQFSLPNKPLYITLTAVGIGILMLGFLFFRRSAARPTTT